MCLPSFPHSNSLQIRQTNKSISHLYHQDLSDEKHVDERRKAEIEEEKLRKMILIRINPKYVFWVNTPSELTIPQKIKLRRLQHERRRMEEKVSIWKNIYQIQILLHMNIMFHLFFFSSSTFVRSRTFLLS